MNGGAVQAGRIDRHTGADQLPGSCRSSALGPALDLGEGAPGGSAKTDRHLLQWIGAISIILGSRRRRIRGAQFAESTDHRAVIHGSHGIRLTAALIGGMVGGRGNLPGGGVKILRGERANGNRQHKQAGQGDTDYGAFPDQECIFHSVNSPSPGV